MIGRADIEGSKSNVAVNAWLPQASYPYGNLSDAPGRTRSAHKGALSRGFPACRDAETSGQESFCPCALRQVSVLAELSLGHLRYSLIDVPPQPNSPPAAVLDFGRGGDELPPLSLKLASGFDPIRHPNTIQ